MTENNQKQLAYLQNIFKNLPHGAVNLSSKTSKILNQLKKHQDKELDLLSNLQEVASNEKFEIRIAIFHIQYQKLKSGAFTRQKFYEELNCMMLEEMLPQFNFWAGLMWYMRNEKDESEFLNLVKQFDFENDNLEVPINKNAGNVETTTPEDSISENPVPNKKRKLIKTSGKSSSNADQQNKITILSSSSKTGRKNQLRNSKNIKITDNLQSSEDDDEDSSYGPENLTINRESDNETFSCKTFDANDKQTNSKILNMTPMRTMTSRSIANQNKQNEKNSIIIDSSSDSDESSKNDSYTSSKPKRPKRQAALQRPVYNQTQNQKSTEKKKPKKSKKQAKKNQQIEEEEDQEFEVEAFLDHTPKNARNRKTVKKYLVKWKGYDDPKENTWQDAAQMHLQVSETVDEYWAKKNRENEEKKIQELVSQVIPNDPKDVDEIPEAEIVESVSGGLTMVDDSSDNE